MSDDRERFRVRWWAERELGATDPSVTFTDVQTAGDGVRTALVLAPGEDAICRALRGVAEGNVQIEPVQERAAPKGARYMRMGDW